MSRRAARWLDVGRGDPTVVLAVRPGTSLRRSSRISRWVRALLPSALLVVSAAPPASTADDVITLDVDAVADAGPLSVAAALARRSGG